MSGCRHDFFNYTSGRWLINEDVRLTSCLCEYELRCLAVQSVSRTFQDVDTMAKLNESSFNCIFLITTHDGLQMIAHVPCPVTVPKFYAAASEVATIRFLHAKDLPVPKVYSYSPTLDHAVKTKYIFMEFIAGTKLSSVWMELEGAEDASVVHQMVEPRARIMSIPFLAGGSLYYVGKGVCLSQHIGSRRWGDTHCMGNHSVFRLPLYHSSALNKRYIFLIHVDASQAMPTRT